MKINKKILIPVFATAMGLSVIGGITGAVAWYQYNSRVTASFVGTSVADTGVLEIGHEVVDDNNTPDDTTDDTTSIVWGRDFSYNDGSAVNLIPVTFGQLAAHNALPSEGAWAYPEAGAGAGYHDETRVNSRGVSLPGWKHAEEGKHYAQFDVYVRATTTDKNADNSGRSNPVDREVFISDYVLQTVTADKAVEEALRIHISAEGEEDAILLSNTAKTNMALSGKMDLDNSGHLDTYHSTFANDNLDPSLFEENPTAGDDIVYGVSTDKQTTQAVSALKASRDSDGFIASADRSKTVFSTGTGENGIKLTVTIWLEGWDLLSNSTAVWNPFYTAGAEVQVGLQFDTGAFRGADLSQYGA